MAESVSAGEEITARATMETTIGSHSRGGGQGGHSRLDVVVFGASGFTGKFVAAELLKRASEDAARTGRKWSLGVAGRSREKLESLVEAFSHLGHARGVDVAIIVADATDPQSLAAMSQRTRLVLNCVGPFRYWGEPVVAACIEAGIDYLDITGEAEFMERMEAKYHSKAVDNGSIVVSGCGFDSVPADLGVLYTASKFQPPCVPHSVESFVTFHAGKEGVRGHYGTWETATMSFRHAESFRKFRATLPKRLQPDIPGPAAQRPKGSYWEERMQAYALPFPGSDASVVRRTQQTLWARPRSLLPAFSDEPCRPEEEASSSNADGQTADKVSAGLLGSFRPVHYGAYFTVKSRWILFLFAIFGSLFQWLAAREFGKKLLLKYPRFFSYGLFSHEGPTQEQLKNTSFSMTFVGRGYIEGAPQDTTKKPNLEIVTRIRGPEMGYIATSIILVQCALTLLEQRSELARGGVYTPGVVFAGTDLLKALRTRGIRVDDVSVNRS